MRKVFLILSAVLFTLNGFSQNKKNVIDEVIWIVGDEAILKSDVEAIIQDAAMRRIPLEGDPYCLFPEQIAVEKLFLHQAAIDSIEVNESAVVEMADRDINAYVANVGSVAKAEEYLHKPIAQLKEEMRERYRNQSMVQQMQQELVKNIEATPAEVRRHYGNISADSLPTIPAQVELQMLSLKPPIPLTEINRVKEQLRGFTERANKTPGDFSLLARLYSDDKGSAVQGGELGFAGRGVYDPDFAAVAFNMQDPNKISRIVETQFGFHIIQFIERRGDRVNVRHILMRPKASAEDKEKGISTLDSIADQIRTEKISFEQAVMRFSQDKNTRMNAGLMMRSDPYTRSITSKFEYQDLPAEIAKVAYDMNVGEVSKAFTMIDQATGNEVITIIKIKSKTPSHKANVKDDYQILKSMLEEQKKAEFLKEWIAKKQKQTYISIDPAYRNCEFEHPGWVKE